MRTTPPRSARRSLLALGLGTALVAGALATAAPAAAGPGKGHGNGHGNGHGRGPAYGVSAPKVVTTDDGKLRGSVVDRSYRTFEGIRYAAAPVGDLRFRPPEPAQDWRGVRDAREPGSPCPQLRSASNPTTSVDEDCLFLNVTTPAGLDAERDDLPVMVWIHGGSWRTGSGDRYDAGKVAVEGDVVVVTINYRLGPLGFLAQEDLSDALGDVGSGSAGLLDQQAALEWVEENIDAFGGDPDNVTIFGESAGASSVCAQLAAPGAERLFDKAIAQSYSCTTRYASLDEAEEVGAGVAAELGCAGENVVRCLEEAAVEDLLAAWPGSGGSFVVGGSALPVQPADAIASGGWNRVPLIHGNNSDENTLFVPLNPSVAALANDADGFTAADYAAVVGATFGTDAAAVLARYPAGSYPSPLRALAAVNSDAGSALSTCAHVEAYEALTTDPGATTVYAYQFRDQTADPLVDFPYPGYPEDAQHATELPYLFPGLFGDGLTPEQEQLSTAMVAYWTNFAADGNPNGDGVPAWHPYADSSYVQGLDITSDGGIGPVDVAAEANCGFWASLN